MIALDSFEASNMPSSKSNSHDLFCLANNCLCNLLASLAIMFCKLVSCWSRFFLSLIISSSFSKSSASFTSSYSLVNILYLSFNKFFCPFFCKLGSPLTSFVSLWFKLSSSLRESILLSTILNSASLRSFSSSASVELFSSLLFSDNESSFGVSLFSSFSLESESSNSRLSINSAIMWLNSLWFLTQLSSALSFIFKFLSNRFFQ